MESSTEYLNFHPINNNTINSEKSQNSIEPIKSTDRTHHKNRSKTVHGNALTKTGGRNSLQNFKISKNGLIRNHPFENNEGLSLDIEENSTIISFLRFDKANSTDGQPRSEYVKNFDWNAINNTSPLYGDSKKTETKRSPLNDILSKNITMLLENLLKNYENSQLPTHGKGKPIEIIHIYVYVHSVD